MISVSDVFFGSILLPKKSRQERQQQGRRQPQPHENPAAGIFRVSIKGGVGRPKPSLPVQKIDVRLGGEGEKAAGLGDLALGRNRDVVETSIVAASHRHRLGQMEDLGNLPPIPESAHREKGGEEGEEAHGGSQKDQAEKPAQEKNERLLSFGVPRPIIGRFQALLNSTQRMEREPYSKPAWGNRTFGVPASPAAAAATRSGV